MVWKVLCCWAPEERALNSSWEYVCFSLRTSQRQQQKIGFDENKWNSAARKPNTEGTRPAKAALDLLPLGHGDSAAISCPFLSLLIGLLPPTLKKELILKKMLTILF